MLFTKKGMSERNEGGRCGESRNLPLLVDQGREEARAEERTHCGSGKQRT